MKYSSRILFAALLAFSGFTATPAASSGITLVGGTEQDHADVAWASERFDKAGLVLPPVVVEFHADDAGCDGYDGVFRGGEDPFRIDVCNANRYIVMHELAHAWDQHNLTDEMREEFMELRGLTSWNGSGSWKERGVEAVAEVITWGLYDHDITADREQKREKERAFELITGESPRRQATEAGGGTRTRAIEDPVDAETGWDELR
ncbi:MAG: hypothetical protein BMS9Abin07_2239 [Acidimicrobiia bacterium]|nr:MAG: hypothetical protein BMS9Abin07_2239 [Acidimicrobiia bacterium]